MHTNGNAHNSSNGAQVERLGYTVKEVAEAIPCSEVHVHRLIAAGKLRSVKVGRLRIVPASALRNMIEGQAA